jgi:hypothetical protein
MEIKLEKKMTRLIAIWIGWTTFSLCFLFPKSLFTFRIGPNPELVIFSICIDSYFSYFVVVTFCFCNSVVRTIHHNIVQPWIVNEIQDTKNQNEIDAIFCYEISSISTVYIWFDFIMYMSIIMTQIDLLCIEVFADLIMTMILTKYYLNQKNIHYSSMFTLV